MPIFIVDRVRVTESARGRMLELMRHRKRRIRKKHSNTLVVMQPLMADAPVFWREMWRLHASGVRFTPRGERRIVRAMCKAGHQTRSAVPRR